MIILLGLMLVLGLAAAMTFFLISAGGRLRILDHPNERSLHSVPTPRTGGLAIWTGMITGMALIVIIYGLQSGVIWIFCAAFLVGLISFFDDRWHVPVPIRLVVQLGAALLLVDESGAPVWWPHAEISLPIGVVWLFELLFIVWMTNLYNFMDGMDGYAGGMTVVGFGTMGLLGYLSGDDYYAAICWVIVCAAVGFQIWNFPPARIFMGDTGSSTLGLLAAALSLWADRAQLFPLWLSILIFSPFIVDATLTLAQRTLRGKRIWEAHRSHYYQRLVQAGWSHRRTVLWEYALMLLCSLSACAAYKASARVQWIILGGMAGIYLLGIMGVHAVEKRKTVSQASKTA